VPSRYELALAPGHMQVMAPRWFAGRVVLLGDACGCVSLLAGQGASLAMAAAYVRVQPSIAAPGFGAQHRRLVHAPVDVASGGACAAPPARRRPHRPARHRLARASATMRRWIRRPAA
jgi:hypothetical protein